MLRYWALFCVIGAAVSVLVAFPKAQRERRLKKHGRTATGICRGHLNPEAESEPMRVRCGIRTYPEQKGEIWVVVRTHERIPQVGEQFTVVYDPEDPLHAESLDVIRESRVWGYGDLASLPVWALLFLLYGGCMAAASD
ncbi:DUF3592 domain-containing protein [Streptomyces swartbergensis]|uniref:DUF3592 domain-containing protein n=1 Tax=Streptomyces swartbergensis TaxID=487165 RepID=A0A243S0Y3_9ACTN|nr:DUF3592 domain-containing protein [Streptomyces swartbergensis]OUD01180.1 hypothetical protein CA983_21655 [Streptomyces swartbergensis]